MEWISINDRLPNIGEQVLVVNDECQYVAWRESETLYDGDIGWEYSFCCGCMCKNVTHWRILPEPPKQ